MFDWFSNNFDLFQSWLFEAIIQPLLYALDMGGNAELAFVGTTWFLAGVMQIIVLITVIGPLQRWKPVEPVVDRQAVRSDIIYTLFHRLGVFKLGIFFTLDPLWSFALGYLRSGGLPTFHLDELWPGVTDQALVSFFLYLILFDFVGYWYHRSQHQFEWWWRLHSLHHSQRQMTMWTDNRNHLLDDILRDTALTAVAVLFGVPPAQFVALVALSQLSESFQHANVRVWFGQIGERLWVSPRFHRLHHSIGIGHETNGPQTLGGHNFGVLLPWWDMLLGTANFELRFDATGVRDQVENCRNYGQGILAQQWLGVMRLLGRA